ncbi:hypothetical protein DPMN_005313 [Dreissena polymorpha]|uniref:NuBaID C-terminal domain-containing protein n=1 Tax=Dreissena polymorpha TaxID=45954 RepID=A0A9D4RWQ0_DREPO|nr:hypothetical protein DPMN_005313 [Dreissena polymorpha]
MSLITCDNNFIQQEKKQCFDPVAEHRFWCPWIQCEVPEKGGHVAGSSPSPSVAIANAEHADTAGRPGWLRVVKILCHSDEGNELHVQLKKVLKWVKYSVGDVLMH